METPNRHTGHSMLRMYLVLAIMLAWILSSNGRSAVLAQGNAAFVRQVREIETADLGIPHPAGLAFSPAANAFQVVPAHPSDQPPPPFRDLSAVTLVEEPAGSVRIPAASPEPINIAFDGRIGRLLLLQPAGQRAVGQAGPFIWARRCSLRVAPIDLGRLPLLFW